MKLAIVGSRYRWALPVLHHVIQLVAPQWNLAGLLKVQRERGWLDMARMDYITSIIIHQPGDYKTHTHTLHSMIDA